MSLQYFHLLCWVYFPQIAAVMSLLGVSVTLITFAIEGVMRKHGPPRWLLGFIGAWGGCIVILTFCTFWKF